MVGRDEVAVEVNPGMPERQPALFRLQRRSWFQIILVSAICSYCPGVSCLPSSPLYTMYSTSDAAPDVYNALTGLGSSGQVDPTVAANASVALLSATAATALFVVGPIFNRIGPRACLLLGGLTYPL